MLLLTIALFSKSHLERESLCLSEESPAPSALVSSTFQLLTLLPRALGCHHVSSAVIWQSGFCPHGWAACGGRRQAPRTLAALGAGTVTGVQRNTSSPCHSIWLAQGHLCPFKGGPCYRGVKDLLTSAHGAAPGLSAGRWHKFACCAGSTGEQSSSQKVILVADSWVTC